jgi:hypothetical protein
MLTQWLPDTENKLPPNASHQARRWDPVTLPPAPFQHARPQPLGHARPDAATRRPHFRCWGTRSTAVAPAWLPPAGRQAQPAATTLTISCRSQPCAPRPRVRAHSTRRWAWAPWS